MRRGDGWLIDCCVIVRSIAHGANKAKHSVLSRAIQCNGLIYLPNKAKHSVLQRRLVLCAKKVERESGSHLSRAIKCNGLRCESVLSRNI